MARIEANPNPALLVWGRESAGLTIEAAAKKIDVSVDRVRDWESGEQRPTFAQLRKVAEVYKRPLAAFYLQEAPKRFEAMHDFRRGREADAVSQSPELTLEIRKAHDRREWALALFKELESEPPKITQTISGDTDPEVTAAHIRKFLGVTLQQQMAWKDQYEAFRGWRALVEAAGILTFQATGIDVSEARGFSIGDRPLPVAVVNIKDAPRGRIFTLLHEIAHILLRSGGVCDLHETENDADSRIEALCNRIAGAILFPRDELLNTPVVRRHKQGEVSWSDEELAVLSRHFGGSREAALVRLMALGLTSITFYRKQRDVFLKLFAEQRRQQKGFAPPHQIALSSAGPTFTGLVIESFNRERITASDVSDYLQIRLKHLAEVQKDYSTFVA
jgi:Zn-dependent peptidase ImmA (M78 family)